jgi:hypothetical protein
MRITGVDLHTRQQTIAMLDADTGELVEKTLEHDGKQVREFYSAPRKSSGRDRSHRIDALVSEADGRAGDRMPRRPSSENPQGRDPLAKVRLPLGPSLIGATRTFLRALLGSGLVLLCGIAAWAQTSKRTWRAEDIPSIYVVRDRQTWIHLQALCLNVKRSRYADGFCDCDASSSC